MEPSYGNISWKSNTFHKLCWICRRRFKCIWIWWRWKSSRSSFSSSKSFCLNWKIFLWHDWAFKIKNTCNFCCVWLFNSRRCISTRNVRLQYFYQRPIKGFSSWTTFSKNGYRWRIWWWDLGWCQNAFWAIWTVWLFSWRWNGCIENM